MFSRFIFRAVGYLLCALVLNVLVAWGLAYWVNHRIHGTESGAMAGPTPEFESWLVNRKQFPGYLEFYSNWLDAGIQPQRPARRPYGDPSALVPNWLDSFRPASSGLGRHARMATAWGWPAVSLWSEEAGEATGDVPPFVVQVGPSIRAGFVIRDTGTSVVNDPRVLPVRPIWINTAWNTLFYTGILVVLHQPILVARRRLRIRRGLCPRCKYNLAGTDSGCAECGWKR